MFAQLGATWTVAAGVVIAAFGIYLTFIVLVRLLGQRSLASMSSFDFGCAVALGAVIGRTVLLADPSLISGIVALVILFAIQGALGWLRQYPVADRLINRPPVLLMVGEEMVRQNMRRAHVTEDELRQRLRLAGIGRLEQVACVVLERNGQVSVLPRGVDLDPRLLADVPGSERVATPTTPGDAREGDVGQPQRGAG